MTDGQTDRRHKHLLSCVFAAKKLVFGLIPKYFGRYNTAVKNTRIVGSKTAELIVWLVTEGLSSYDRIHVLGRDSNGR